MTVTRIMAMGDSITWGYSPDGSVPSGQLSPHDIGWRQNCYERLIANGYPTDMVGPYQSGDVPQPRHFAVGGIKIAELRGALISLGLGSPPPDLVLLMAGTNDCGSPISYPGAADRMGLLIDEIATRAPLAEILVSTLLPASLWSIQAGVADFNSRLPGIVAGRLAAGRRVRMVTVGSSVPVSDLPDGIHPRLASYAAMGEAWSAAAIAALGPPPKVTSQIQRLGPGRWVVTHVIEDPAGV